MCFGPERSSTTRGGSFSIQHTPQSRLQAAQCHQTQRNATKSQKIKGWLTSSGCRRSQVIRKQVAFLFIFRERYLFCVFLGNQTLQPLFFLSFQIAVCLKRTFERSFSSAPAPIDDDELRSPNKAFCLWKGRWGLPHDPHWHRCPEGTLILKSPCWPPGGCRSGAKPRTQNPPPPLGIFQMLQFLYHLKLLIQKMAPEPLLQQSLLTDLSKVR